MLLSRCPRVNPGHSIRFCPPNTSRLDSPLTLRALVFLAPLSRQTPPTSKHMSTTVRQIVVALCIWFPSFWAQASQTAKHPPTPHSELTIYACTNELGITTFTDRGCLTGPKITLSTINIVQTNTQKPATRAPARKKEQAPAKPRNDELWVQREQNCMDAKSGLDKLRERRRRGYRLRDSAMLDKREAQLHDQRREFC